MSNKFHIIRNGNNEHLDLIVSMYRLRYEIFHRQLRWNKGLKLVREMEFDEYDNAEAVYIVRTNEHNVVDATCRLIPTDKPYMLAEHYPEFIEAMPIPQTSAIWEISRFCASEDARLSTRGKITGQLIAAAIEFGIANDVRNYIALATDTVIPIIRRIAGWDPTPLGERRKTPDDHAYSVIYTISQAMLENIRRKNGITNTLLSDDFSTATFPAVKEVVAA